VESPLVFMPFSENFTWPVGWRDALDIALMTFLIYQAFLQFRGTRAARVGASLAAMGVLYFLAHAAGLFLTSWVLSGIWAASFVLVIIVFQTEIRQILEQVNSVIPSFKMFRRLHHPHDFTDALMAIATTCFTLASKHWGALLVFERRDSLESQLRSLGVVVDARVSSQLLENFFTPQASLHDGAVYIRADRIYRAGCILPLSETKSLPHFYGTRHRAAVGITEHSDAFAIVVSEERGTVAAVERGGMVILPGAPELYTWLVARLVHPAKKRFLKWPGYALLTNNWQAKLGALAGVVLLWLVLVGLQNAEVGFNIPVIYDNIPAHLDLTGNRTQEVYLRVRGSRELIGLLDPSRLQARINLRDGQEGTRRYSLSAQDVNIPLGLQVAEVDPTTVTVRLKKKPPPEKPVSKNEAAKTPS